MTNALFQLVFSQPFHDKVLELVRENAGKWTAHLPAHKTPRGFDLQIDENGHSTHETQGIEFAFLRPDGRPAWAFRVLGNTVMVECSRYTRWRSVFGQAQQHIQAFVDLVADWCPEHHLVQTILVMRDDFVWFGDRSEYALAEILRPTEFVAAKCFDAGAVWHSNAAWFDSDVESDTLTTLAVMSAHSDDICESKNADAHINVTHAQDFRPKAPMTISALKQSFGPAFTSVLETMHARNKELLRKILVAETAQQIGLHQ
nr:hypothetical protein [uncultured Devosia sp.]